MSKSKKRKSSRVKGFFKLDRKERIKTIKEFAGLNKREVSFLAKGLEGKEFLEQMSENVIGSFPLPYSVAANFLINGKDYFIPMVIEEVSVVAAASFGAKLSRQSGGITTQTKGKHVIGQIYIIGAKKPSSAKKKILDSKTSLLAKANKQDPVLNEKGGGAEGLEVKILKGSQKKSFLRIHLLVDTKDAMGANAINRMTESVAPMLEGLSGGKAILKIVSNLPDNKIVEAKAVITQEALRKEGLPAKETIDGVVSAQEIAEKDIYRAVTHNKGILNGMGAVALATGNDWRALEAAAHGFAARSGRYLPFTKWDKDKAGNLRGEIKLPVMIGTVGGATSVHPLVDISFKILKIDSARELGEIMAGVGLLQNFAALRALVSDGIQRGHRRVMAWNLARQAGARGKLLESVVEKIEKEDNISLRKIKEIIKNG